MVEGLARDDVIGWAFVENDRDVVARHFEENNDVDLSFLEVKIRISWDVEREGREGGEEGVMR